MRIFKTTLCIGGISILLESSSKDFIKSIKSKYNNFLSFVEEDNYFKIVFSQGKFLKKDEGIIVKRDGSNYSIKGEGFCGYLDIKRKTALVNISFKENVFNLFLRIFYSLILPFYEGFLIHSAGLKKGDDSYILSGPSSSGKTTAARLADREFCILSDELVIIRKMWGVFTAFATPFPGEFTGCIKNDKAALKGLFFLNKNLIVPYAIKSRLETLVSLLENIFFFCPDSESNRLIFNICGEITNKIRGYDINILYYSDFGRIMYEITEENVCPQP